MSQHCGIVVSPRRISPQQHVSLIIVSVLGLLCASITCISFATASATFSINPATPMNCNAASDSEIDKDPALATDGLGTWVAVWQTTNDLGGTIGNDRDIVFARSTDNGNTWSCPPVALNSYSSFDTSFDSAPSIATDGNGNWVVAWITQFNLNGDNPNGDFEVIVSRSSDNGQTWSPAAWMDVGHVSGNTRVEDDPKIATDGQAWIVTWSMQVPTGNNVLYSRSTDAGLTWSLPGPLANSQEGFSATIAADVQGNWVAVMASIDPLGSLGTDLDILTTHSTDGGVTWTNVAALNTNADTDGSTSDGLPDVTTDGNGNWIAVYATAGTTIHTARSTDVGATWTPPSVLNANAGSGSNSQPFIEADGAGAWVVGWHSTDDLGATIGNDSDILVSASSDVGSSWTFPVPLNSTASTDSQEDSNVRGLAVGMGQWIGVWESTDQLGSQMIGNDRDLVYARFTVATAVSVSGVVSADCQGALQGVTVDLDHPDGTMRTTSTDATGMYAFTGVPQSANNGVISIVIPLGYTADNPTDGQAVFPLNGNQVVDFTLACVDPVGEARSVGYWKHQTNVFLKGKGNAQETQADMETNYPGAIYDHFHENQLNGIAVEGVTFLAGPTALDLASIAATLTVNNGGTMQDRAKQQYLAFLLNVASGKLLTSSVVSDDGATASQALQHVACIINQDPECAEGFEVAKDISDTINNAQLVQAGVVDLRFDEIAYKVGRVSVSTQYSLSRNRPNPFNPRTTIELALPVSGSYSVVIHNVVGRVVRRFGGVAQPGVVSIVWDGTDNTGVRIGSGLYFYTAEAAGFVETRRMLLVK